MNRAFGRGRGAVRELKIYPTNKNQIRRAHQRGITRKNIMNKGIALALLAIGIMLIVFGINSTDSFGSQFSKFFTGTPTDKSMWLLLGGVALTVVGAVGSLRPLRKL